MPFCPCRVCRSILKAHLYETVMHFSHDAHTAIKRWRYNYPLIAAYSAPKQRSRLNCSQTVSAIVWLHLRPFEIAVPQRPAHETCQTLPSCTQKSPCPVELAHEHVINVSVWACVSVCVHGPVGCILLYVGEARSQCQKPCVCAWSWCFPDSLCARTFSQWNKVISFDQNAEGLRQRNTRPHTENDSKRDVYMNNILWLRCNDLMSFHVCPYFNKSAYESWT